MAPLFVFSFESEMWVNSFKAFIAFCFVSSSIYLINDCIDINSDKKHPTKKYRIIASGQVSQKSATQLSLILLIISLSIGFILNNNVGFIIILYFLIQILYCFYIKNIPLIEFFCIASGFILRSIAGGLSANIIISPWFLLSIGMVSLFLAVEKRKAELLNIKTNKPLTRKVLKNYSLKLINKFESVLSTCTVMTYSIWAYGPIIGGAKSSWMLITIPIVVLGVFRYQMLSENGYEEDEYRFSKCIVETPERIILNDKPMRIIIFSWILITTLIGFVS